MAIERSRDQRQFGRRAVFKAAVVAFDDGRRLAVTVLDHSDGGAKIKGSSPEFLNGEFFLEIPGDDLVVRCCVVHVEGAVAGLQFVKPPRRLSWIKK